MVTCVPIEVKLVPEEGSCLENRSGRQHSETAQPLKLQGTRCYGAVQLGILVICISELMICHHYALHFAGIALKMPPFSRA